MAAIFRRQLEINFLERESLSSLIDKPALVQTIAWYFSGTKPLCEPVIAYFTDAYVRHSALMSLENSPIFHVQNATHLQKSSKILMNMKVTICHGNIISKVGVLKNITRMLSFRISFDNRKRI